MPLTNEEAFQAFKFLASVLRDLGFPWVVTQVEEKIALGKVQTKKLRPQETLEFLDESWDPEELPKHRSRRAAFFAVAEEYDPHERLDILIESIELAIPTVREIARETLSKLGDVDIHELHFEPEAEISTSFGLTPDDIALGSEHSKQLVRLLDELRNG